MARRLPLIQINVPGRGAWFSGENHRRTERVKRVLGLTFGAALLLAGCMVHAPADFGDGAALYAENCAICHGPGARGDGVLAADLPVAPADLTGLAARNGGAFPWSMVMAKVHGYSGRADVMPEFGTVLTGPTVTWQDENGTPVETPVGLLAIARYLESIQA